MATSLELFSNIPLGSTVSPGVLSEDNPAPTTEYTGKHLGMQSSRAITQSILPMEIVTVDREQKGAAGSAHDPAEGRTPTLSSEVAPYGFKLIHWWQVVVWCLKWSFVELWGRVRWAGQSAFSRPPALPEFGNSHAAAIPRSPCLPASDTLKDGPYHNEPPAAADFSEPNDPTTAHCLPSYPSEEAEEAITNPPPHTHSAQTDPPDPAIPKTNALCQPNFQPAKSFFQGCVQQPEGKPSGGGSYSDVFRCPIQFVTPSKAHPIEVAVKVLRRVGLDNHPDTEADERLQQRLQQEARTWLSLPEHPNIVPLIGWTLRPNLSLISPWYNKGNLGRHLKNLSDAQRIYIPLGIAKGLNCLHSHKPPVVHGDLKPVNVLLSDQGEPLLTDFGLSTIMGEEKTYTTSHRIGGSVAWMSPECIEGEFRSLQSDIYSLASLAFTVLTGERPYDKLTDAQVAIRVCNSNSPNGPVGDWSRYPQLQGPIKDLLLDCWSRSPSARPSISVVVERLTTLVGSNGLNSGSPALSHD